MKCMISGIIDNFATSVKGAEKSLVKFLVKSEDEAGNSDRIVYAEIPNDALKFDMVKIGSAISWKDAVIFIEIEGVKNVAFKKGSKPAGNDSTFFEKLRNTKFLEEKGSKGL